MQNAAKKVETFFSGGPGTTGREPFEDSTASGPAAAYDSRGPTSGSTGTALGGAGTGATQHDTTPSGQYGSVSNISGDGHHHAVHSHHSHHDNGHIAGAGAGAGATGATGATGAGLAATAAQREAAGEGPATGAQGGSATDAATRAAATQGQSATSGNDRVGSLGQNSHLYESTGASGPISEGAAGTDKFDAKGSTAGAGAGGLGYAGQEQQETTQRAEEKSSGGIAGVLGTSDKDFTGRERLGTGAYVDDKGVFSENTHGPGGKTALTGREGDVSKNPVAQAKGMVKEAETGVAGTGPSTGVAGTGAATGAAGTGAGASGLSKSTSKGSMGSEKKKGFLNKVKEALT